MRKKINSEAGLTLMEMLAATAILILLALMLGTGMQMALRTYKTMITQNEVELLLSSALDAVADDLRYAREAEWSSGKLVYNSDSYGDGVSLSISTGDKLAGQIVAIGAGGELPVLPTGAYGSNASYKEYKVTALEIQLFAEGEDAFSVTLEVTAADGSFTAKRGTTVRCLNPLKDV